ncbi:TonB-dependent receptor plug domain-containing protein [Bacteroides salyersiae]|nr:TonB-dependent receptor plug domain-containing protein [Bacteroides salyersiae]
MRITLLLAFISVFSLNAKDVRSQNARITLSQTNSPIEVIINEIESQTDYLFIVNSSIDTSKKVSIKVKDATVASVLNQLLKGTNVSYSTEGSYIILSQHKSQPNNNDLTQEIKDIIVTGNITDTLGEPLIGVNVILKGTNIGTISDIDGNYSLKIPEGKGEIQFSYIGYRNIVIPIGSKTVINVKMEEDSKVLGEVVITAMGIERKAESLTYATQTVGGNELTRAKEANLINSLQGKSAGLVITPNSGGAGSASKILLRGNASILGNNSPLIVVDGVPMTNSVSGQTELNGGANLMENGSSEGSDALSQLNPDDIASITVLKGANSAALYGSAASNGVLMITTKKGQQGSMRVDVSSSTTFETPLTLPKLQNVYGAAVIGSDEDGYRISQDSWGVN